MSPDVMKKLNEAFLSYFDGKQPGKSSIDLSEENAILDLIKSGIEEKSSKSVEGNEAKKMIVIGEGFIEAGDETITYSDDQDMQMEPAVSSPAFGQGVPDVLSNAFDDVSYQSVEIEVEEPEKSSESKDRDYSKTVSDILERTSKVPKVSSYHHDESSGTVPKKETLTAKNTSKPQNEFNLKEKTGAPRKPITSQQTKAAPSQVKQEPMVETTRSVPSSSEPSPQRKKVNDKVSTSSPLKPEVSGNIKKEPFSSVQTSEKHPSQKVSDSQISKLFRKASEKTSVDASFSNNPPAISGAKKTAKPINKVPDNPSSPVNIAFLYSKDHMQHDASLLSIITHEKPERIIKAMWYLEKNNVFSDGTCTLIGDFQAASEEDLHRVHGKEYISFVKSYSGSGGGFLGDSTYMTSGSYEIARTAAGAAMQAGDLLVDGKFTHAFVLTRPPGHHASSQKYGGFCLFNNAAVLARHLQHNRKVGKVMILDWDAHAGDGTMEIFYEDPSVMLLSLHRDPHGFYPRKGFSTEVGENAGKGYTMNVEMPEGSSNDEYMLAFDEVVLPMVEHFNPDFIILSCGFDAHYQEMNIGLELDSDGYHQMTAKLHSVFKGPIVFLLEGGYHDFNGQLCHSVLSSLQGRPNPVNDKQQTSSYKRNQQKQIFEEARKKVAESKRNHPVFSSQVA